MAEKVALITGSGRRRLGNAVALAAAERGYSVVLHYKTARSEAEETALLVTERSSKAVVLQGDVTSEEDVRRIVRGAVDAFGRIDLLVTAASAWRPTPFDDISASELREDFEVNTLGTALVAREAGMVMVKQAEGGVIITMGDSMVDTPYRGYLSYFTSKGAIETLTRALAVELAAINPRVRANCIMPGAVLLPEDMPIEQQDAIAENTLLKRLGTPEHIVKAVFALVDNDYLTGTSLVVDGGKSLTS